MATHSIVLAWRIPETGEPGGLPSMGLHRVGHNRNDLAGAAAAEANNSRAYENFLGATHAGHSTRLVEATTRLLFCRIVLQLSNRLA